MKQKEKGITLAKLREGDQIDFTHALMDRDTPDLMGAIEWAEASGRNRVQVPARGFGCPKTALGASVGKPCTTVHPLCTCLPGYRIIREDI